MIGIVHLIFTVYTWGLIIYVILSWIQNPQAMQARQWLGRFYDPLLEPIRNLLGSFGAGGVQIDFSPFILLILLFVLERLVLSALL